MHRGTLPAAGVTIGLFLAVITAWMVLSPVSVEAYSATLRNARTGAVVRCDVRGQRQDHPENAFDLCVMACGDKGFNQVAGNWAKTFIDFRDDASRQRAMRRVARFIPAACRE
jgi:hypothetical protein